MLSQKFVEELFRPQPMYSMNSAKQIFEKLAHSSIMKLNATSMQKLFDLMLMGVKYQALQCTMPKELFSVTSKHLDAIAQLVPNSAAETLVLDCHKRFKNMCKQYQSYDFFIVRQQLFKFF